jgi:hypothetical protein
MAPQLTAMKGPRAREPRQWMARATSSLPVPLSPVMRTVDCTCEAALATRRASRIEALSATGAA